MKVLSPIKEITKTVPFGKDFSNDPEKKDFYLLFDGKHPGVDFIIPVGTKVYAAIPGIVVRKEFHKGMGNVIATRYGNIYSLYAHLNKSNLKLGQIIKAQDLIGISGNTGAATTEPHLHFEMRDLTETELKKMVFDPPINKQLSNLQETFKYKVKNDNTPKNLNLLAERYFGDKKYFELIAKINNIKMTPGKIIKDGEIITIPNYMELHGETRVSCF